MKKYKVNVNGTNYEIVIELINESEVKSTTTSQPVSNTPPSTGDEKVTSPMPGTILSINVNVGDTVKKGQVLMVLEALKMENEIMAGRDGKITSIAVAKGAAVESGSLLCTIQ